MGVGRKSTPRTDSASACRTPFSRGNKTQTRAEPAPARRTRSATGIDGLRTSDGIKKPREHARGVLARTNPAAQRGCAETRATRRRCARR